MKSIELTLTNSEKITLSLEAFSYAEERGLGACVCLNYGIELDGQVVTKFDVLESVTAINAIING